MKSMVKRLVSLSACCFATTLSLAGCSMLPHSGPSASAMRDADLRHFVVLVITPAHAVDMATTEKKRESRQLQESLETLRTWGRTAPQANRITVGDHLSVTLWTNQMNLFNGTTLAAPLNKAVLGRFVVDSQGKIMIPYVGLVNARGLTLTALEQKLNHRYARTRQFIAPYTSVHWSTQGHLQGVLISGNVRHPGLVAWHPGGLRLAEIIAHAAPEAALQTGPSEQFAHPETFVTVAYRGYQMRLPIAVVWVHHLHVAPGSHIVVSQMAGNKITLLGGGIMKQGNFAFAQPPSLNTVIAAAGGLNTNTANDREIFVMRPPLSRNSKAQLMVLRWNTARGFLASQEMPLHNGDVVYVPTAPVVSLQKAVQIFSGFLLPPALLASAIKW